MNATMIIECPNCGTKYKVIPEAIKPRGRTVHCTTCSNKWHVDAVPAPVSDWEERFTPDSFAVEPEAGPETQQDEPYHEAPVETPEVEPEPASPLPLKHDDDEHESFMVATPRVASEAEQTHQGKGASFGLVAATLALLVGSTFALHSQIERLWPASARIYQAVGLEAGAVTGQGLALQDVHAYLVQEGTTGPMLNLEAKVVNTQETPAMVPGLDALLVTTNGETARHWTVVPGTNRLEAGASTVIKASVDGANTENGKILLTFSADNSVGSK